MKEYAANIRASDLSLVEGPTTSDNAKADAPAATDATAPVGANSARVSALAREDRFFAKAVKERAAGYVDAALWAHALQRAGGDKARATRIYLDGRATALRAAKRDENATRRALVVEKLSQAPETGFLTEEHEARDKPVAKTTERTRRGRAQSSRRHLILIAGGLASAVVAVVGAMALWSGNDPVPQASASAADASKRPTSTRQAATAPRAPARDDLSVEEMAAKVQALEQSGSWNMLVIYAAEWARKQPANAEAWNELSRGYAKLRQWTEAVDAATKATQLAPEDYLLWQNLGQVNMAVPRAPEALAAFQRAAALNEQDVVSLAQIGVLNTQLGHLPEARVALDKALAMRPDDVPALCGAASLAQKEGRAKDAEAMTAQAITLDGRCPDPSGGEIRRVAVVEPASGSRKPLTADRPH